MTHSVSVNVGGRDIVFETGKFARQADGAVVVRCGDTIVLVTAVAAKEAVEGRDFFPLTVEYRERTYAAGKIPGGFFKREGRPTEREVLISRLIDRPIRPLFPEGFLCETQVMATVLSADTENDSDVLAVNGASAALVVSDIPFDGPIGAVRIGYVDDELVVNPTFEQMEESLFNLTVAGTESAITTIEASAKEVPEELVMRALELAQRQITKIIECQKELAEKVGKAKREVAKEELPEGLETKVRELVEKDLWRIYEISEKRQRREFVDNLIQMAIEQLSEEYPECEAKIVGVVTEIEKEMIRSRILKEGYRVDGRGPRDIRFITCEVGLLPRAHGSALFTRGQTQSLCTVTLGVSEDEQIIEGLVEETTKRFMVHYNFPPFSVGEVRPLRGPGRREIGHGALAEKSLFAIVPSEDEFPYTIRIVSDILESNGSSSMATVCGGTLALMDAGVPIKAPVAGVALGLIYEDENNWVVLSDIMGEEDHYGDMDFKVAGTREGITGIQVDTKIDGIPLDVVKVALEQAKEGRLYVLDIMERTISQPRSNISVYAPKVFVIHIPKDKIGEVIGPGGRVIRAIIEETGAKIEIEDDGRVMVSSTDESACESAMDRIKAITQPVEIGRTYVGKVTRIMPFGVFVELLPGKEGLVHVSELDRYRIPRIEEKFKVGDEMVVKVIGVDEMGRINLSRKAVQSNPVLGEPPSRGGRTHKRRFDNNRERKSFDSKKK